MNDKFLQRCSEDCYPIPAFDVDHRKNNGICSLSDDFIPSQGESCPERGVGLKTPKIFLRTHEFVLNSRFYPKTSIFFDVFRKLSGKWSQKCLTARQVMYFCGRYLIDFPIQKTAFFLCKKDEDRPIDSEFPTSNLYVTEVFIHPGGYFLVRYHTFDIKNPSNTSLFQEKPEVENNNWIFVSPIIEA